MAVHPDLIMALFGDEDGAPIVHAVNCHDELVRALEGLIADVADYEAWQRPCHALDVARAALAKAKAP